MLHATRWVTPAPKARSRVGPSCRIDRGRGHDRTSGVGAGGRRPPGPHRVGGCRSSPPIASHRRRRRPGASRRRCPGSDQGGSWVAVAGPPDRGAHPVRGRCAPRFHASGSVVDTHRCTLGRRSRAHLRLRRPGARSPLAGGPEATSRAIRVGARTASAAARPSPLVRPPRFRLCGPELLQRDPAHADDQRHRAHEHHGGGVRRERAAALRRARRTSLSGRRDVGPAAVDPRHCALPDPARGVRRGGAEGSSCWWQRTPLCTNGWPGSTPQLAATSWPVRCCGRRRRRTAETARRSPAPTGALRARRAPTRPRTRAGCGPGPSRSTHAADPTPRRAGRRP